MVSRNTIYLTETSILACMNGESCGFVATVQKVQIDLLRWSFQFINIEYFHKSIA